MDLVSQTTKRALEASLKKLLLQKPLNKITINDITEDCGVNRMTFYYHFKDIYDLVDWIMVEDAAKALEGRQSFENWTDAFLDILHQVQDNKVLVMNVYRSVSREQLEQYLYKLLDSMLRDFVDRSAQGFTVQDSDKKLVSGDRNREKFMTYEWDMCRAEGSVTTREGAMQSVSCPGCGAPLSINTTAKCPYCGRVVTLDEHDWALCAIKGISQTTR